MKLEIDNEVAQGLVLSMLSEDIELLEKEIGNLKKIKKRKEHQNRELQHSLLYLDAIKQTRHYYGGIQYKC